MLPCYDVKEVCRLYIKEVCRLYINRLPSSTAKRLRIQPARCGGNNHRVYFLEFSASSGIASKVTKLASLRPHSGGAHWWEKALLREKRIMTSARLN